MRDWAHQTVVLPVGIASSAGGPGRITLKGYCQGERFSLCAAQAMVLLHLLELSYRSTAAMKKALGGKWHLLLCSARCKRKGFGKRRPLVVPLKSLVCLPLLKRPLVGEAFGVW